MLSTSFSEARARRKRDIWGWSVEGAWSVRGADTVVLLLPMLPSPFHTVRSLDAPLFHIICDAVVHVS